MKTTKLFFDTEFTGLHQNTTLISIGIVSECGKTFYAELNDYDELQVTPWIKENVIAKLLMTPPPKGQDEEYVATRHESNPQGNNLYKGYSVKLRCDKKELKNHLSIWLQQFEEVEMWSDCLAYDWVLFVNIFGCAFDIPKNVSYIPFDICTLFKLKDIDPDISREKYGCGEHYSEMPKHNALWDAQVIKMCFERLLPFDKLMNHE